MSRQRTQPRQPTDGRVFYQPARPMFWLYVGLMVFAGFQTATIFGPFIELTPMALMISLVFNGVLAFLFIRLINWMDLFEREPVSLLVAAFAWGAVIATSLAVHSNDLLVAVANKLGLDEWGAALAAPLDEETFKLLGVVVVIVIGRAYIDRPMDGLILGMMSGLGFEVSENLMYGVQAAIADVNSDIDAAIQTNLTRLLVGVGGHVLYTGITGLGVGYAVTRTDRSAFARGLAVVGTFALAWAFHFLWDGPIVEAYVGIAVKYLMLLVAFFLLYRYAARREWDWFVSTMSNQPPDVITPAEMTSMRTLRARRRARKLAKRSGGRPAKQRVRNLQDSQLGYAIAINRSRDPDRDPEVLDRWDEINRIRSEEDVK